MQSYDWDHIDPDYPEGCDRPYQMVCGFTNPLNLVERNRSLNSRKSNRFLPWRVAKNELGSVPVNPGDLCQFLDRATGEWVLEEFLGDWWFEQTRDLCGNYISGVLSFLNKKAIHEPGVSDEGRSRGGKTQGPQNVVSGLLDRIRTPETCSKGGKACFEKEKGIFGATQEEKAEYAKLGGLSVFEKKVGIGSYTSEQLSAQASSPWWYNPSTLETTRSDVSPGEGWEQRRGPTPWSKPYENVNVDKYICLQTGYISTAAGVAAWQKKRGIPHSKRVKLTPEESAFIFLWAP